MTDALPICDLTRLIHLYLACGDGQGYFVRALAKLKRLQHLQLISHHGVELGAGGLAMLTELTHLALRRSDLGAVGAQALAFLPKLQHLDLWLCEAMGRRGVMALAGATALTYLDLANSA